MFFRYIYNHKNLLEEFIQRNYRNSFEEFIQPNEHIPIVTKNVNTPVAKPKKEVECFMFSHYTYTKLRKIIRGSDLNLQVCKL